MKMGPVVLCIMQACDVVETLSGKHFSCQLGVMANIDGKKSTL